MDYSKALKKNLKLLETGKEHATGTKNVNRIQHNAAEQSSQPNDKPDESEKEKRMIIIDGSNIAYG